MSLLNYTHTKVQISTSHAVELTNVDRVFGKRAVLNGINLTIRQAEFVAVLGPSGTRKTTLLRLLSGLDRTDSGLVRVAANRSFVFQEPRLVLAKRVWENVVLGRKGRGARRDALQALEEVGLRNHPVFYTWVLKIGIMRMYSKLTC